MTKTGESALAKHTIYPDDQTPEQVIQAAKERLPITSENELVAIVKTHQNAVDKQKQNTCPPVEPVIH